MKQSSLCLLSALGGALVGAMVAVLVTPQTGKELRGKIREAFDEATAKLHASGCDCEK